MNKERVFSDRLNLLDSKLDKILEILTADKQPEAYAESVVVSPSAIVETALEYLGLHELHDKAALMALFKETDVLFNGSVLDPDETSWCAAFEYAICKKAGFDVPFALNARAFADIGEEADEVEIGDIAVWGSHVATVAGFADKFEGKITTLEEWEKVKSDAGTIMVIGGNQSNMVNISPKNWYDNYSEFLGYRRLVS